MKSKSLYGRGNFGIKLTAKKSLKAKIYFGAKGDNVQRSYTEYSYNGKGTCPGRLRREIGSDEQGSLINTLIRRTHYS